MFKTLVIVCLLRQFKIDEIDSYFWFYAARTIENNISFKFLSAMWKVYTAFLSESL